MEVADTYDNPKTIKVFEVQKAEKEGWFLFRAVTHLRTHLIGFQAEVGNVYLKEFENKCKAHGHRRAWMLEVGRVA